jgi:type II secretory pathway component PulJ
MRLAASGSFASPSGRRAQREASAFTLLEVIVALFVFMIVLASLFATWTIVLRSNAAALRMATEAHRARMAIRTVEDAIVSAEMVTGPNSRYYAFQLAGEGDFSSISFVGHLSESFPGSGYFGGERVRRVTFGVDKNQLFMQQRSMLAVPDTEDGSYPVELAKDVQAFIIEVWDPRRSEWTQEWGADKTNSLPRMMRVTLEVGDLNKQKIGQVVSRVISLPGAGIAGGLQGN